MTIYSLEVLLFLFGISLFSHVQFASGDQNSGVSALASVLPMIFQGWFQVWLTSLVSLLSKGLPGVFSTAVGSYQFFGPQPSLLSICHNEAWSPGKAWPLLYVPLFTEWYMGLFLGSLLFSIDLCVCFYVNIIMFRLWLLCNILWNQKV